MTEERRFPIAGDPHGRIGIRPETTHIPWWLAELAYQDYSKRFGTRQSLERLAERGGFSRWELISHLSGDDERADKMVPTRRNTKDVNDEIALRAALTQDSNDE